MSEQPRKYTVSELAEILQVPRTTVNDWLARYGQYIDFKIQGKRKIYLDSTLTVLQEIAQLREREMSSFDIEEELAKHHPVHGEITSFSPADDEENDEDAEMSGNINPVRAEQLPELAQREYALITKKQTDEITRLISEQLGMMNERIREIEEAAKGHNRKAGLWYTISLALVAVLIIAGFFGYREFISLLNHNETLNKDFSARLSNVYQQVESSGKANLELSKRNLELTEKAESRNSEIKLLRDNLDRQEREFSEMLEKEKQDSAKIREAEILKLRDDFAKKRLDFLKQLEDATRNGSEKDRLIEKLHKQALEQSTALKNLSKDIFEEIRRTRNNPAPPSPAVPAKTVDKTPAATPGNVSGKPGPQAIPEKMPAPQKTGNAGPPAPAPAAVPPVKTDKP